MTEEINVTNPMSPTDKVLEGIAKVLATREAPPVINKPVFEKDLEVLPGRSLAKAFGTPFADTDKGPVETAINFGSKQDTKFMSDEVRMRLFGLKQLVSDCIVQAQYMFKSERLSPSQIMEAPLYKSQLESMLKAYSVTDFSSWIPTVHPRFFFSEYEIPFLLANEFDQQPMDSATVEVPGDTGLLEGFEETDVATFTEQSNAQASYTVYSRNNVVHAKISEDLMSDSAPKYIDKLRKDVVTGIARAYEKCLINGDTTGTPRGASHFDSDIAALALNATFCKAFKGFRRLAYDADALVGAGKRVYDHGGDTASKTLFENTMKLLGKFATEKDDLIWLISPTVDNQIVAGAIPELFTAFAFGGLASNVTGKTPSIFGIKPVVSQYMREDLNSSGVYNASGVLTQILCIKRSRFLNYVRQAVKIWAAPTLPSSDQMLMTAKMRHAMAGNPQTLKEISVVGARNVAL
jgi:hypothetical protein